MDKKILIFIGTQLILLSQTLALMNTESIREQMIDMGGYRLRIQTAGLDHLKKRALMIVLKAGTVNSSNTWKDVQPRITRFDLTLQMTVPAIGLQILMPQRCINLPILTLGGA